MTNFTQIPNELLDYMKELGIPNNKYLLILIYILRHKKGYRLSNKQIENSLSMHHKTVKQGIKFLQENNFINYEETKQGKIYSFDSLFKKLNDVKSAEGDINADAKNAEHGGLADGASAEGGDISAEGSRPYRRDNAALAPTNYTNYKTKNNNNYNTTSVSFDEIVSLVRKRIDYFFENMIDETIDKIINEIDPSFYQFKNYIPSNKEIEDFLSNNSSELLDKFHIYLYNGIISESFVFNDKLIKPRLALLNKNRVRLKELEKIYYDNLEEVVMEKPEETEIMKKRKELNKGAPTFEEFLKQNETTTSKEDPLTKLPPEEREWVQALHSYDPNKEGDLIDFRANPNYTPKEDKVTEDDIDEIIKETGEYEEKELSTEEIDELLSEM